MFAPDDIVISRAHKDPNTAPRSVVIKVYDDGRFLRYCPRYNAKYIVDRPELWKKVGRRGDDKDNGR